MKPTPATRANARALTAGTDDRRTMRRMGFALAALTALGVAFAAQPVLADPPGGVPPGLAKKGVSKQEWKRSKGGGDARDYDRDRDRDVVVIRERDRDRVVYEPGYRLPRDRDYVVIRDYDRYGLRRPPSGYEYYLVDDRVMRVSQDTLQIAAVLGLASALLN